MEDRGLAGRERQRQVPAQVRELCVRRRPHPVEVEPGLADRSDRGIRGHRDDLRPIAVVRLGRCVRVHADADEDPGQAHRQLESALAAKASALR